MISVVALACWVMTGYKLRHLARDPGNRPLRYLCLTLAALSLPLTIDPFGALLDRAVGVLDLGRVTGICLVVVAAGAAQCVLLYLPGTGEDIDRQVQRRTLAMLGCVAAIVAVFLLTPARYSLTDPYVRSGAYYQTTPTPAAAPYMPIYNAYVAWAGLQGAILSLRLARSTTQILLRLGLRLAAAGSALGIGYIATKVIASIAAAEHAHQLTAIDALIAPLYTTTTVTLLIGATIPSWGTRIGLDRIPANLAARRDCRQLQPLWNLIHQATPEVALLPHPTQPPLRRTRMIVEILDGYVQLTPWLTTTTTQQTNTTPTRQDHTDATTEATQLTTAAHHKLTGQPPTTNPTIPPTSPLHPDNQTDPTTQIACLIHIARALPNHHPITTTVKPTKARPHTSS